MLNHHCNLTHALILATIVAGVCAYVNFCPTRFFLIPLDSEFNPLSSYDHIKGTGGNLKVQDAIETSVGYAGSVWLQPALKPGRCVLCWLAG